MATLHHHHHHIKAPSPTWLLKAKPLSKDVAKKAATAVAYSPILLSPSVWEKAQKDKKKESKNKKSTSERCTAEPASPKIGCMGQIKGGSPARGSAPRGSGGGVLARLATVLFARRRASSKVRDVPRVTAPWGSSGGCGAAAACVFDPPLPVVRRPAAAAARDENGVSLWERRRGSGRTLEVLRLP